MGSEFFTDEKKWVSSRRAAEISGYAPDYIGQLCRKGLLECRLIGRGWFVTETSLLEHKNSARAKPSKNIERSHKILIQKAEPRVIEPSPIISDVPDNWDVFLFSSANEENKNIESAHSKNFKDAPAYTQNIGAIYPDAVESVLHKKNNFFNFSEYLYLFSTKALVPLTLLVALGVGGFYIKDTLSNSYAALFNSKQIVFETDVKNIPISSTLSSRLEHLVNTLQSPFDKKITYAQVESGNAFSPSNNGSVYIEHIKSAGMFVAAVNVAELFSTEKLLDAIQNIGKGYTCVVGYISGDSTCFAQNQKNIADKGFFNALIADIGSRFYNAVNTLVFVIKERAIGLFIPDTPTLVKNQDITGAAERLARETTGTEGLFTENIPIATSTEPKQQEVVFNPINEKELLAREAVSQLEQQGLSVAPSEGKQTIVEKIVERVVAGITPEDVSLQLNALENKLRQEIFKVGESGAGGIRIVERQVALTNKIDQLPDVTLINATVSGTFDGLTDAHIPNDITAANYLEIAGGNITGTFGIGTSTPTEDFAVANRIYVGGTGTSTIENNLSIGGALGVGEVCLNCAGSNNLGGAALSVTGTSTFSGQLLSTNVPTVPHSFSTWEIDVAEANPLTASFVINPESAAADTNLFAISVAGGAKFLVDAEGDVFSNSLTAVGGTTLSTTTASTFTVENTSTFGDATTTDRTYFNSRIGSSLIPTADNLLDIGDTTNALAWRTGIFGTSIGIGTTSPYAPLSVVGEAVAEYFSATSTTATSTFSGNISIAGNALIGIGTYILDAATSTFTQGISISDGCFAIDDVCLSGASIGSSVSGGIANSVLFVNSSGNLAQNNANFFWNDTLLSLNATQASSSRLSVFDTAYFGGTATSTFDSAGALTLASALAIGSGGTATTTFYDSGVVFYNDTLGTLSQASAQSGLVFDNTNSRLGVGTSSPSKRLSVSEEVSDAQVAIAYDDTRYAHLQVDSAGDLIVISQGGDVRLNNENLFVCAGGACPTGTPSAQGSIIAETEIGIGTSSPTAQLGVADNIFIGGGGAPALGTATSTFAGDIIILGKLDVGTIDPAYTIGGTTYATYGHSTVGIKEEVAVKIDVAVFNKQSGYYEHRIDFDDLLSGSDLWLFYQITNFGEQWENLVVTLTPAFDGRVFYTEDRKNNRLIVSSTVSGAVSVRLIAPRFDSDAWENIRSDQNSWKGFILNIKEKIKK